MHLALETLLLSLIALASSYITVRLVASTKSESLLTLDVHKPVPVKIPKVGGLCLLVSSILVLCALCLLRGLTCRILEIYVPALALGAVGLADDLVGLSPAVRVVASLVVAAVVALLLCPSCYISFIGKIYSKTLVEILAILTILIFSNAVNMLDVMNGIVPSSTCIILATLTLCLLVRGSIQSALFMPIILAQYLPLLLYNKYPARVLNGNVGSYLTGALLGGIACAFGLYLEVVLTSMPYIVNGLLILASTRGRVLASGRLGVDRPIRCVSGKLEPNLSPNAVTTLVRLVVLSGADTEYKVVNKITLLFIVSCLVAVAVSCLGALASC